MPERSTDRGEMALKAYSRLLTAATRWRDMYPTISNSTNEFLASPSLSAMLLPCICTL